MEKTFLFFLVLFTPRFLQNATYTHIQITHLKTRNLIYFDSEKYESCDLKIQDQIYIYKSQYCFNKLNITTRGTHLILMNSSKIKKPKKNSHSLYVRVPMKNWPYLVLD